MVEIRISRRAQNENTSAPRLARPLLMKVEKLWESAILGASVP